MLVTPPEVAPSGHSLGLYPVPNSLPGADRWEPDSAPATPQDSLTIGHSWCQQYPPSTDHLPGRLAWSTVGGWVRNDVNLVSKDRWQRLWGKGLWGYFEPGMWGKVQLESLAPRGSQACPYSLTNLHRSSSGQSWLGLWTPEAAGRDSHWPLGRQVSDLSHGGGKAGRS